MGKSCFLCKKELGFFHRKLSPEELKRYGNAIPEKMTDDDVVCRDCYDSSLIDTVGQRPNGGKPIFIIVLLIAVAISLFLSIYLGEPNLFPFS